MIRISYYLEVAVPIFSGMEPNIFSPVYNELSTMSQLNILNS